MVKLLSRFPVTYNKFLPNHFTTEKFRWSGTKVLQRFRSLSTLSKVPKATLLGAILFGAMAVTDSAVCQSSYRKWLMSFFRWVPTSNTELKLAEEKVLSHVKTPFKSSMVNIGKGTSWNEDNYINTITMNTECDNEGRLPLVLIHGFCSGIGLWALNLDAFAANRAVYVMDLLGFGRSSRPTFSKVALETEHQYVESIEDWREKMGLERFILLGHSMGGFLAASYALQHPDRVAHLILADPWGLPEKPVSRSRSDRPPLWVQALVKVITGLSFFTGNALAIIRVAGPMGPKIVDFVRPDIRKMFDPLIEDSAIIPNYIYHCNAQTPNGEAAFSAMSLKFGWAKHPMVNRIIELKEDVPITFIFGSRSWIDQQPGMNVKYARGNSFVDIEVIQGAGHHVYAERHDRFNSLVENACQRVDVVKAQSLNESIDNNDPSDESTKAERVLVFLKQLDQASNQVLDTIPDKVKS